MGKKEGKMGILDGAIEQSDLQLENHENHENHVGEQ